MDTKSRSRVYHENFISQAYLNNTVVAGDVVVTHHLPSHLAVAPQYAGHPINCFFVCPMDDLIEKAQPNAWLFGHTHFRTDFSIGKSRVLCNPYGYHPGDLNPAFDPNLIMETK